MIRWINRMTWSGTHAMMSIIKATKVNGREISAPEYTMSIKGSNTDLTWTDRDKIPRSKKTNVQQSYSFTCWMKSTIFELFDETFAFERNTMCAHLPRHRFKQPFLLSSAGVYRSVKVIRSWSMSRIICSARVVVFTGTECTWWARLIWTAFHSLPSVP